MEGTVDKHVRSILGKLELAETEGDRQWPDGCHLPRVPRKRREPPRALDDQGLRGQTPVLARTPSCVQDDRVAIYEYRCSDCGIFERSMPMGTATESSPCPTCGRDANRVFSVPMTYRTAKALATMLAREEASRDYPEVVERVPPRQQPRRSTTSQSAPARLPKP